MSIVSQIPHAVRLALAALTLSLTSCAGARSDPASPATPCAEPLVEGGTEPALEDPQAWVREHYIKTEVRIPMRDGVKLHTVIYAPRDRSRDYPMLMKRTPYSVGPYGDEGVMTTLGPSEQLMRDGYIFVYQDVRGRFMSEGEFVNMTPHAAAARAGGDASAIDESTDTYDTVAWLVENVEGNNGRVGQWGISYPGFYAAAGMIDHHPALVAVSPQAPIADWFFDDFHHHGAFWLPHAFNFLAVFGQKREGLTTEWPERFQHGTPDGYDFFLDLGPLKNANERHFHGEIAFWNDLVAHPNYDGYWQARNLLPHLENVAPAVMTVGGWFDAEDLYGPLQIYRSIEEKNPDVFNMLVMGPWAHGYWSRMDGDHLGNAYFGAKTSVFYREEIERRFFQHYLQGDGSGDPGLPEAYLFETGANEWREFASWPPPQLEPHVFYVEADGALRMDEAPKARKASDAFISDPGRPVPFSEDVDKGMTKAYMTDDQRFASRRPDVLTYQTEVLAEDLTLAGPLVAELWVSTDQQDADWIVKVIDVFPGDAEDHEFLARGKHMGGYQMMVRSEAIRGRFRDSYRDPKPFQPGTPTRVRLPLQDVLHTFEKGHRVMIQIQSTWFPMVDRNPQKWVDNVFEAEASDFTPAEHRVWRDAKHPTRLEVGVLPN